MLIKLTASVVILVAALEVSGPARVIDGDTLDIGPTRIRMKGISAPERSEAGGREATEALKGMIGSQAVTCSLTGEKTRGRKARVFEFIIYAVFFP